MSRQPSRAQLDFLLTEARLGLTMLETARITNDPEHARRAVQHATRAYETILRFRHEMALTERDAEQLEGVLKPLEDGLTRTPQKP